MLISIAAQASLTAKSGKFTTEEPIAPHCNILFIAKLQTRSAGQVLRDSAYRPPAINAIAFNKSQLAVFQPHSSHLPVASLVPATFQHCFIKYIHNLLNM
jgi:hypothetical protein